MYQWSINIPLRIEAFEKRIIENCNVIINAPVEVYGKLVFRNCTIASLPRGILIYGSLKIQQCKINAEAPFLQIMDNGEYLFDIYHFDHPIPGAKAGNLHWINDPNVERWMEESIPVCVAEYYGIEKEWLDGKGLMERPDTEIKIAKEAAWISIWLRKKILQIPTYKIAHQLAYPTYLAADVWEEIQTSVENGDRPLWKNIAEIEATISRKLYERDLVDEKNYPHRD